MKKRIISCFVCIVFLFSTVTAFAATDRNAIQLFGHRASGNTLDVMMYANTDTNFSERNISVSLGGTELPVEKFQPYASDERGTSWIVVMEPNGYESVQKMVNSLVRTIASNLNEKDNLTIYNASRNEKNEFLSSESTIMQLADAVLKSNGDIKLFDTVNSALNTLKTSTELNERKCLLIISEGSDKASSYTLSEACKTAEQLPIAVYTVGITRGSESLTNNFKNLSELTRATTSGMAIAVDNFNEPAEEGASVANQLLTNEKNCYIVSANFSGLTEKQPDFTRIAVSLQLEKEKLEDAIENVDAKPFNAVVKDSAEETSAEVAVPDTFPQNVIYQVRENWPIKDMRINIAIAAAVLVLILLLIISASRRKAKKKAAANLQEEEEELASSSETGPVEEPESDGTMPLSKVTITLTNVVSGEAITGNIYDYSLKAGRSSKMALLGDPSISGEHMEFIWQNGCLYVQDTNSTNGTKVNGKGIKGAVALNQSDVIHAGKSDFRVNWRSNH